MKYLLDSGVLLAFLRGRAGAVAYISPFIENNEVVTCVVCYAEFIERFQGLPHYLQNVTATRQLLRIIKPLSLTYAALEQYAVIRRNLRPIGQLIGDIDTLIAAVALVNNLTIVTVDHDFQRVSGLASISLTKAQILEAPSTGP